MGKYKVILIDPPWDNRDSITPKDDFSTYEGGWPYGTMLLEDIAKLPVKDLADPSGCHLYLWTMNSFLPHACWLMQEWGFKYQTLVTWVKPSGVGHWWVNRTQHMLFGYTGKLVMRNKNTDNVFGAPALKHSEKPDISYEVIEHVSPGPYVELFARRARPGWDVWGDQVEITPDLKGIKV